MLSSFFLILLKLHCCRELNLKLQWLSLLVRVFSEIAASFAKGVHFNTFGGNPVACAIASSVLDVSILHASLHWSYTSALESSVVKLYYF